MRSLGQYAVTQAVGRLDQVLSDDADTRTGKLAASIEVFEAVDNRMVAGSNREYAAQVHRGGRIDPKPPNRALAIPLPAKLKRSRQWPRQLDPNRDELSFVPIRGGASGNVIGLLVDDEGTLGFGRGEALFALAKYVDQPPRPYMYWDDEDLAAITDDLWPAFLGE